MSLVNGGEPTIEPTAKNCVELFQCIFVSKSTRQSSEAITLPETNGKFSHENPMVGSDDSFPSGSLGLIFQGWNLTVSFRECKCTTV